MYGRPKNDIEYSQQRLEQILRRRRLCFNPYTVSDQKLLEIATTTGWGTPLDITQITTVTFTRLREVRDIREFDGIYMAVANNPEEIFLHKNIFVYPVTALDTLQPMRSRISNYAVTNTGHVEKMVSKRYFVSRVIPGKRGCAYQMYRLKGNIAKDAEMIRRAMCMAKIEMLERLLKNAESDIWLDCKKGLFEYEPRVRRAIEIIRHFSDHPIPQE